MTPNIDAQGRRRRRLGGALAGAGAVVAVAVMIYADAPRAVRLATFPLFYGAALGFLQAHEST